jgi:hypothetical protein
MALILFGEPLRGGSKRIREPRRHVDVGEIGRLPELNLGGGHMDPQIRTQPLLHSVDEQPADMIHVHVGQDHVGHGGQVDADSREPLDQLPGPRQVQVRVEAQPGVDEDGLPAAADNDHV